MKPVCHKCQTQANYKDSTHCNRCGTKFISGEELAEYEQMQAQKEEEVEVRKEVLTKSASVYVSTLPYPAAMDSAEQLGMVFGTSSKQAFWGLSTQADRLSRAYQAALRNIKYEAALLGADSVYGITFALNNSTGSSASRIAGSSEAVMLLGTAVKSK